MGKRLFILAVVVAALMVASVAVVSADSGSSGGNSASSVGYTVSGVVWQDYCVSDCTAGSSLRAGNGVPDEAELRLAGVTVGLGNGWCRWSHPVRFTTTNTAGQYSFGGLSNGVYCVTVESRQSNTKFPKPGVWTRPSGRSPWHIASYSVVLHGSGRGYLNFGWLTLNPS
jgi:hypothetical protein